MKFPARKQFAAARDARANSENVVVGVTFCRKCLSLGLVSCLRGVNTARGTSLNTIVNFPARKQFAAARGARAHSENIVVGVTSCRKCLSLGLVCAVS